MATTTPNFGWPVPTSTDLVKDGATAIEALGDGVDASFLDLKGGTTGQVLAKTSGTDLDFTWVTTDDANAIQNSIVDAKGDLISATANDTPARLAVGNNGETLVVDSSTTTGLKYIVPIIQDTWTSVTPTITSQSGTITSTTSTLLHKTVGKTVFFTVSINFTNAGTGAGFIKCTLPSTPNASFTGTAQNTNTTGIAGTAQIPNGDSNAYIANYINGTFIATGAIIVASGMYRIA